MEYNSTKHLCFTKDDFTKEEIERDNILAVAVIKEDRKICKLCGEESPFVRDTCLSLEERKNG